MCGIAGLFNVSASLLERDARATVLSAMATSIAHRGPDAAGEWHDAHGRCSLAHRRLSIIDLSDAANQPMLSADADG